jgi:hypothetical protein
MGAHHSFAVGFLTGLELGKELRRESFYCVGQERPRSVIWKVR